MLADAALASTRALMGRDEAADFACITALSTETHRRVDLDEDADDLGEIC